MTEVNPQVSQKIMRSSPIGLILDVPDTPYENKGGKVYPLNPVIHNIPNEIGHRTYAIILNGGMYPEANYLAAWNSCSYVYRTLVQGYGVPKDHIYPLMSDGDDPAADTHDLANKILISQNLDLDGDGSIAGDEILSSGTTEISMNIDASKKGIYSVSYQRGSAVWDSKKIMVK